VSRQNTYDDERFFGSYQRMRQAQTGLNEALEQPSMLELLPTVRGAVVLDLGCGDGALSRELANRGAAQVTGVDPSGRMLGLARRRTADDRITYLRAFAEDLDLPDASFDLVVSSLAFHYLSGESFHTLVNAVPRWLRPDGTIVASMEHPVKTAAPDRPTVISRQSATMPRKHGGDGREQPDRRHHRPCPVPTGVGDPHRWPCYRPMTQFALQITGESTVACEPFQPILAASAGSM
jgi:ubiquinone/menaquinone biosynthesis C-methylase UbiE